MAMYGYTEDCPNCGRKIKLHVDTSSGPPREIGTECECGMFPVFRVQWDYDIWLNGFDHYEPSNNGVQLTRRAGEIVNEESGGEQLKPGS